MGAYVCLPFWARWLHFVSFHSSFFFSHSLSLSFFSVSLPDVSPNFGTLQSWWSQRQLYIFFGSPFLWWQTLLSKRTERLLQQRGHPFHHKGPPPPMLIRHQSQTQPTTSSSSSSRRTMIDRQQKEKKLHSLPTLFFRFRRSLTGLATQKQTNKQTAY